MDIPAIYEVKTSRIRLKEPVETLGQSISSPAIACKILRQLLETEDDPMREHFYVVYCNTASIPITWQRMFVGGISSVEIDIRIIFKRALIHGATTIILAHNHPSGNVEPSDADKRITRRIQDVGNLLDIRVLDHIVFSLVNEEYTSFADHHLL